jgi:hypothetical protein
MPVAPALVRDGVYWSTKTDVASVVGQFAGMTTSNTHLQTTPALNTSSIMVPAVAGKKIIVNEISVTQTGGAIGYVGTVAQEGETADIVQFACGQYGQARFNSMFELEVNKGLVLYRAQGETNGGATADANCVTVWYAYVDGE